MNHSSPVSSAAELYEPLLLVTTQPTFISDRSPEEGPATHMQTLPLSVRRKLYRIQLESVCDSCRCRCTCSTARRYGSIRRSAGTGGTTGGHPFVLSKRELFPSFSACSLIKEGKPGNSGKLSARENSFCIYKGVEKFVLWRHESMVFRRIINF